MKKKIFIGIFSLLCFISCTQVKNDTESKIDNLIKKMTLEEKIGQMNQLSSYGSIEYMSKLIKKGKVGSILNEINPDRINALQHVAIEESRLGIPLLVARDVIHGYKTIFPIPLGQAATFDPSVAFDGARVAAKEASSVGIRWTFAPMIDIARDPRWGRVAEGCGEDPYLTSVMGVAMIKGFQGDSLSNPSSIAACAKHFVAYGAAEGGRDYNSTFIPKLLLRNVFFPPFKAATDAGVASFMTSFNNNNGIPSTGNSYILKDVLRNDWKFNGFVVSDWNSVKEMVNHGFSTNDKNAAEKSINAGLDMDMVSEAYIRNLPQLVKEGKVKESDIDYAVRNILRIKYKLGLFENPYVQTNNKNNFYKKEYLAKAKRAAEESVILLKNKDQILPLKSSLKTLAIVGPMANAPYEQLGTWTFDGEANHTITPLEAIKKQYGEKVNILYSPGLEYSRDKNIKGIKKAVSIASKADVILAFVGEEAILSGEAHSLADLNLKGAQSKLIEDLAKTGKPVVTIVMAGRPLTIEKEVEESAGVLYSFHPGTMGGPAIADLLFGKKIPSGKTPITFPKAVGQIPIYYAHNRIGRPATHKETLIDDIPVHAGQTSLGCTSFYLDLGFDPLFPFGFGLSYTTFKYSDIKILNSKLKQNDTLKVSFKLQNIGKYAGSEIAQLYIQDKVGSITRPIKELKRFMRIKLHPGEVKKLEFTLPVSELAFYTLNEKKVIEPGDFCLWVSGDSQSGKEIPFEIVE